MAVANWPPAKGPKPPHLEVSTTYIVPKVRRRDFSFKQPEVAAAERRAILEAVFEHYDNKSVSEKVHMMIPLFKKQKKSRRRDCDFLLDYDLETVAGLTFEQADRLLNGYGMNTKRPENELPPKTLYVPLTYPLETGVELEIKPFVVSRSWGDGRREETERMSVGHLLRTVAIEYKRIYADWKHYKIWGHGIDDLHFQFLRITKDYAWVGLGSYEERP